MFTTRGDRGDALRPALGRSQRCGAVKSTLQGEHRRAGDAQGALTVASAPGWAAWRRCSPTRDGFASIDETSLPNEELAGHVGHGLTGWADRAAACI